MIHLDFGKYSGVAFIALAVIVLVACAYVIIPFGTREIPKMNSNASMMKTGGSLQKGVEFGSIDRSKYNLSSAIFADLPTPPKEFYSYTSAVASGTLTDMCLIEKDVFEQPEFYPNFDRSPLNASDFGVGIKMFQNHDSTRWGVIGYGAYPSDAYILTQNGSEFDTCVFFHTSWDVQTWQGIGFSPIYPSVSYDEFNNTIAIQNDSAKDYIKASITPNQVLLSPVFPKFEANWSYRLQFHVKVEENTPKGIYVVGLGLGKPDEKQDQLWAIKYLSHYTASGGKHGLDRPLYRVIVEVR